jgi:hypothetical protein
VISFNGLTVGMYSPVYSEVTVEFIDLFGA